MGCLCSVIKGVDKRRKGDYAEEPKTDVYLLFCKRHTSSPLLHLIKPFILNNRAPT